MLIAPWNYLTSGKKADLSWPWEYEEIIYACDGSMVAAAPRELWQERLRGRICESRLGARVASLLADMRRFEAYPASLEDLSRWAGPLPVARRALLCPDCAGLGTLWGHGPRPCEGCDGAGWLEAQVQGVAVWGVVVDAARLSRLLWALPQLDPESREETVLVRVGAERVALEYGQAKAILMGLSTVEPARKWPA